MMLLLLLVWLLLMMWMLMLKPGGVGCTAPGRGMKRSDQDGGGTNPEEEVPLQRLTNLAP